MSGEDAYLKEEKALGGAEKALVVQMGEDFANVERKSQLLDALEEVGLTADEFRVLVSGNFADAAKPYDEELPYNGIIEKDHVRIAQIGDKQVEVAHAVREEDSTKPSTGFDLQLRQKESAYKILVGLKGEGVLRLPKTAEPAGMIYVSTPEFEDIPFRRGTIALIHAPTAWSFESSKKGFEFLYISHPKFNDATDLVAENPSK